MPPQCALSDQPLLACNIFQHPRQLFQHPEQLPSIYELEELHPSMSDATAYKYIQKLTDATAYKHIQKLTDAGIVKEVASNDDQRRQGYRWKFYGLTDEGLGSSKITTCSLLRRHSNRSTRLFLTKQIYETISDRLEEMIEYENAPAPTIDRPA